MPTDYKKMLEACPLIDEDDRALDRLRRKGGSLDRGSKEILQMSEFSPSTEREIAKDELAAGKAHYAATEASLAAQPELEEEYKQTDPYQTIRRIDAADAGITRTEGMDKSEGDFGKSNEVLAKADRNVRSFCKAPTS